MTARIDLTDRHEQHSDDIRDYAREKAGKLTRYFDGVHHIEVVLDKEHDEHATEIIVTATHHKNFVAKYSHESVMASIDGALDKVERQIVKAKERLRDHHRGTSPTKPS